MNKLYLLTYLSHYEGEYGYLEGPITLVLGVFTSKDEVAKAQQQSGYLEQVFSAQFGSGTDTFEVREMTLNELINKKIK